MKLELDNCPTSALDKSSKDELKNILYVTFRRQAHPIYQLLFLYKSSRFFMRNHTKLLT